MRIWTYWGNWSTGGAPELELLCSFDGTSAADNWDAWERMKAEARERTKLDRDQCREIALFADGDAIYRAFSPPSATARVESDELPVLDGKEER